MTVKELSEELSIKLGDAVSSGSSDGQIFSSDTRLGYIRRAYGKLNRVLKALMRNEAPEFTKSVDYIRFPLTNYQEGGGNGKNEYPLEAFTDIIDVYAFVKSSFNIAVNDDNDFQIEGSLSNNSSGSNILVIKADRIAPYEFLNVLMQKNDLRKPSFEEKQIYYTILNKKLIFLPYVTNKTNKILYQYQGYYMTKSSEVENLVLEDDIYITNNFKDLLITFGAYEGMMDIARQDKVQLYGQEINSQLQILSQFAQLEKREEGVSEQPNK